MVVREDMTQTEFAEINESKQEMLDIMGVMQHHDAITGTSKQAVQNDYQRSMSKAFNKTNKIYSKFINKLADENQDL